MAIMGSQLTLSPRRVQIFQLSFPVSQYADTSKEMHVVEFIDVVWVVFSVAVLLFIFVALQRLYCPADLWEKKGMVDGCV